MAGGTAKREEGPIRPVVAPSRPVVASLAQIVQQADSVPLETLTKEFTDLPNVA